MPIDYDALAKQNGAIPAPVDYDAIAKQNGATTSAPSGMFDSVVSALKHVAEGAHEQLSNIDAAVQGGFQGGLNAARSLVHGDVKTPGMNVLGAINSMAQANAQGYTNMRAALKRGDYTSAAAHLFNYLAPGGAQVEPISQKIDKGEIGNAVGQSLMLGGIMAAPSSPLVKAAIAKIPDIKILPKFTNPNAAEAAAAEFGQANNIPVSAKVATGNKFVAGVQQLADHSPIGSVVAQQAKKAETAAFTRVGGEMAERASPGASVAPTQAGSDIASQIHANISGHAASANAAYDELRQIEADPANIRNVQVGTKKVPALDAKGQTIPGKFTDEPVMEDVALPVDIATVKKQLRPIYDQITRQLPITQQRMSTGLKAIENIINGPDAVPASMADSDLSAIKAAARGEDEVPEMRTLSQGLAAQAVKRLHEAVTDAVGKAERTAPAGAAPAAVTPAAAAPKPNTLTASGSDEMGDWTVSQPAIAPATPAAIAPTSETAITVPGSTDTYKGRYEVRELADVQPSHNGETFAKNPKYGYENDRNYGNAANQRKVVEWSTQSQFDPKYHVTDNPDAVNGPPIIDHEGNVLGGNGRSMMLQRVYKGNPTGAAAYRQMVEQKAAQFGIDPAQVQGMKQPVLVRVLDDAHLDSPEAARDAITNFNKVGTAALTPAEQAVADARRVSPETLSHLSQRLEELGPDATLAQATEGRAGVDILHKLVADKVISPQEVAKYATEDSLTQAGKQRVSQLLLGRFFRDADQIDNLAPALRAKIERVAGPLAKIEAHGDFSLTQHVRDAIDLLEAARRQSMTLEDYLDQSSLIARQQYGPEAQAIAHGITHGNPTEISRVVNDYAEHAKYATEYQGPGMFSEFPDPHTPRSAFNAAFGTQIEEGAAAAPPPPAEIPQPSAAFAEAFKPPPPPAPKPARVPGTPAGNALAALERGRGATKAKFESAGVLQKLPGKGVEGRQVFDQALWANDAGIERLRTVAKEAPAEIPRLGRAFIEDLVTQATADGGFDKARTLSSKWQKLGPETKKLLYPNPLLREDLDKFFLLAKKAGEVTNPSESATVGSMFAGAGYVFMHPATGVPLVIGSGALSKLMHSPAGIRALTRGFSVSVADKAQALLAAERILKIAGADAKPLNNLIEFPSQTQPTEQPARAASR